MQIYVVRAGDNVDEIARQFRIPVERLIYDNQIDYPYRLAVGQALLIAGVDGNDGDRGSGAVGNGIGGPSTGETGAAIAEDGSAKPPLEMNGYAYPFINRQILLDTLPYLTDLSIFSYGFTENGDLVSPAADEQWMIEESMEYQTRPLLVLTPMGEDGHFNNNLVAVLVRDQYVQQRLIRQLWTELQAKGYGGVDVDFEYVLPEDREPFAAFVSRLRQILNLYGYRVTAALAPKTSRDQRGLLYEGIDYRLLGEAANQVMLMTYEWGYT